MKGSAPAIPAVAKIFTNWVFLTVWPPRFIPRRNAKDLKTSPPDPLTFGRGGTQSWDRLPLSRQGEGVGGRGLVILLLLRHLVQEPPFRRRQARHPGGADLVEHPVELCL